MRIWKLLASRNRLRIRPKPAVEPSPRSSESFRPSLRASTADRPGQRDVKRRAADLGKAGRVEAWRWKLDDAAGMAANWTLSDLAAVTRLYEVGNRCVRVGDDFAGCLAAILDGAIFLTGADKGNVQLLDPAAGGLVIAAQRGFGPRFLDFFSQVHAESAAVCGAALAKRERVIVEDVLTSRIFAGPLVREVLSSEGVRAVQSTPLVSSTERVLGMISTHFTQPTRLDERVLRFMDLLARQAADYLERKDTERLLAARQRQLERIAGQAGALIAQCSRDLRFLFVTKPYADFLGKRSELIVGHPLPEVMGDAAFHVIRPYLDRVLAGERVEFETEIPFASAGPRYVHAIYVPDLDSTGTIAGWIATIHDITERKHLATAPWAYTHNFR
jgi:PAS domain S-box-containing protein